MCTISENPMYDDVDGLLVKNVICCSEMVKNEIGRCNPAAYLGQSYTGTEVEEEIIEPVHLRELSSQDNGLLQENCNVGDNTHNNNSPKITRTTKIPPKSFTRVNTRDSMQLDLSQYVSEIFVNHPLQEDERGDSLGGFLCTGVRKNGTFLHAFCTLQENGILAKDLHIKNKNILVRLNEKEVLGSMDYDHNTVIEMFKTLPMEKTISMEIYDRKLHEFQTIEFQLEGIKEDVIVKEESVKQTGSPDEVKALEFQRKAKFFTSENGLLSYKAVANHKMDCASHFVIKKTLDEKTWIKQYSFQLENTSLYLGFNETFVFDNCPNKQNIPRFKRIEKMGESFLSPINKQGNYIYYCTKRDSFVLADCQEALMKEGYGLVFRDTLCRV